MNNYKKVLDIHKIIPKNILNTNYNYRKLSDIEAINKIDNTLKKNKLRKIIKNYVFCLFVLFLRSHSNSRYFFSR